MKALDPLRLCSDEDLVLRLKEGQSDVLGLLIRRYERELYGYLRRYIGDAHLADDVFQNTFLQLFVKVSQYEAGRPVRPWLYTIATNQAIDALRKHQRQTMVSLDQHAAESPEGEVRSLLELLESRDSGPVDRSIDRERRVLIQEWIDHLPDFLRQVVQLAYYQGMKYREIADQLQIPVGTVKSRLHTALLKLQEAGSPVGSLPEL